MGRVFVVGDIHGKPVCIRDTISQIDNPSKDDFIIIAGDAGFEYQDYIMGTAKKETKKFPGKWIVLRGNHDSSYWYEHSHWDENSQEYIPNEGWNFTEDGMYLYQEKYPNIWYIADDGGIYLIGDYNILFIPGAYSVDKYYRLRMNYPWNPQEQLSDKSKDELSLLVIEWLDLGYDIDFVIAHTFPRKLQPKFEDLFMSGLDQSSVDKSMENWLDKMSYLYESCPSFKQYFGGHFHDDRVLTEKYTMLYHGVECLEDYE